MFRQHGIRIDNIYPDSLSSELSLDNSSLDNSSHSDKSITATSSRRGKSWCVEYLDQHGKGRSATGREGSSEGLTKCVFALDAISTFFSMKCDHKAKELQVRKSSDAVCTVNAMTQYRKKLLRILSNSEIAQTSTLTKVFANSFKGVSVFDPPKSSNDSGAALQLRPLFLHIQETFPLPSSIKTPLKATLDTSASSSSSPLPSLQLLSSPQLDQTVSSDSSAIVESGVENKDVTPVGNESFFSWVYKAVVPAALVTMTSEPVVNSTTTPAKDMDNSPSKYELLRSAHLTSQHLVVFSYGACFIQTTPATIYITPQYVCLSIGFPGFTFTTREVYPIARLSSVKVLKPEPKPASSSFSLTHTVQTLQPPSLSMTFFSGAAAKEVKVLPAVLDAYKLRILLTELKEMELFEWFTLPSDPKASMVGTEEVNDDGSNTSTKNIEGNDPSKQTL